MTTEVYNILLGLGVMVVLLVASCALRAEGAGWNRSSNAQCDGLPAEVPARTRTIA